jgi:phage-related protein
MNWTVSFYSTRVESEIFALPAGFLARFIRYAERMEVFGPDLGFPHTRALGGGLFELRLKAEAGIARVFYCTVVDRQIIFLHQFIKKTQQIPRKELDLAISRLRELRHA